LFQHLRQDHYANDALFPATSPLDDLNPLQRTAASIAVRGTYENAAHDAYYQAQVTKGRAWTMAEWDQARVAFKIPLPVAFRTMLPDNTSTKKKDRQQQEEYEEIDVRFRFLQHLKDLVPQGALRPCRAIPSDLALQAVIPPRQWSPEAQRALMDAQDVGAVSRQEVCSMIPPLLLLHKYDDQDDDDDDQITVTNVDKNNSDESSRRDNNPAGVGFSILDLCSAPGSKSLQLLDMLHARSTSTDDSNRSNNFMLVCNDANRMRLLKVARRSRRQPALHKQACLLNSSDGRYFPALRKWGGYKFKFNRVLADVPCSGDGTLRKLSSQGWKRWNVRSHLQIHKLQCRLLVRALECVQKGGRVVYSTCSLDPIEDEAVVVSAIARMGGPDAYRILPMPTSLLTTTSDDGNHDSPDFVVSPGATRWIVPHPDFGKVQSARKVKGLAKAEKVVGTSDTNARIYDTYNSVDQVPEKLRRKEISPSMFAPRARTEGNYRQAYMNEENMEVQNMEVQFDVNNEEASANHNNKTANRVPLTPDEKLRQAWKWGEILSSENIEKFEKMLPNCGRIFPHHLDSGGFFCAVIERVAPAYYPVCYPRQRSLWVGTDDKHNFLCDNTTDQPQQLEYKYHGRILYPVESARQVRDLIAKDKAKGDEVVFEGLATQELAIQWLKQHRSYFKGRSEETIPLVCRQGTSHEMPDPNTEQQQQQLKLMLVKDYVNDPTKSVIYTSFFPTPHPSLVAELVDFFGLYTDLSKAKEASVDVFPADRLVVFVGSGEDEAANVTTCLDPEKAHTLVQRLDMAGTAEKIARKRRFFQLALVSEEIKALYRGGAKFSPMEAGLFLCWVPIPGRYRDHEKENKKIKKRDSPSSEVEENGAKEVVRFEDATARAVRSGRYGIMDEAAEFLGRCATKRVVALDMAQALKLITFSILDARDTDDISAGNDEDVTIGRRYQGNSVWWRRWGSQRLSDLQEWEGGAVIAVAQCCCQGVSTSTGYSNIYLPCVLKRDQANASFELQLLAEQRLIDAFKRLLVAV